MAAWRIVPQQRLHSVTTFFESLQRLLRVPAPPRLLSLPFSPTAAVQTQATWSDWLQLPPLFRTPHGLDFILIPCGEYLLGSADDAGALQAAGLSLPSGLQLTDELPQRHVSLSQPFYIQRGCVTVGQFAEFVAATGYRTECERNGIGGHGCGLDRSLTEQGPSYTWRWPGFRQTREHPVVNVTPSDCLAFADWISSQTAELRACGTLRLPSEAEWEYCCRAGTVTRFPSGAYPSMAVEEAFGRGHNRTSADILSGACRPAWFSAPVLLPWPNPFGLQGLLGTVWQWCSDVSGPASAVQCERMQVQRGGSWALAPRQLRSSLRRLRSTAFCCHRSGFRLILELRASGAFQR
jgi:formylglycine-generating enzyme required for sulfatase activity